MLNKTVPVDQAAAWADIAHTLDRKQNRPWLIWFFFGLSVVATAIWYSTTPLQNPSDSHLAKVAIEKNEANYSQENLNTTESITAKNIELSSPSFTDTLGTAKSTNTKTQKLIPENKNTTLSKQVSSTTGQTLNYASNLESNNKLKPAANHATGLTQKIYKSTLNEKVSAYQSKPNLSEKKLLKTSTTPLTQKLPTINLQKLTRPFVFPNQSSSYVTVEPKLIKKSFWNYFPEIAFTHGVGIVPIASNYTDLSQGEFVEVVNMRNTITGIELLFKIHKGFHFKTGILENSRRYGYKLSSGGSGFDAQYNRSIPLMIQYNLGKRNLQPYIALGMHLNTWYGSRQSATFNNTTGIGLTVDIIKGKRFTPVIEIGTSFKVFNQKFSLAAEANFGDTRVYDSRYGQIEDSRVVEQFGEGYSNGTYFALKAKYHLNVLNLLNFKKKINNIEKPEKEDIRYKNEIGLEAFGVGVFGSIFYQRFWQLNDRLRIAFKPGFLFIPTYKEKGFISGPPDDVKPMGFYVPTSLIAYVGQPKLSMQLGIGNIIHHGPLRTVVPNGKTHRTETAQFLISGVRSEFGRFSIHGQCNVGFSKEEVAPNQKEWEFGLKLGVGAGYQF